MALKLKNNFSADRQVDPQPTLKFYSMWMLISYSNKSPYCLTNRARIKLFYINRAKKTEEKPYKPMFEDWELIDILKKNPKAICLFNRKIPRLQRLILRFWNQAPCLRTDPQNYVGASPVYEKSSVYVRSSPLPGNRALPRDRLPALHTIQRRFFSGRRPLDGKNRLHREVSNKLNRASNASNGPTNFGRNGRATTGAERVFPKSVYRPALNILRPFKRAGTRRPASPRRYSFKASPFFKGVRAGYGRFFARYERAAISSTSALLFKKPIDSTIKLAGYSAIEARRKLAEHEILVFANPGDSRISFQGLFTASKFSKPIRSHLERFYYKKVLAKPFTLLKPRLRWLSRRFLADPHLEPRRPVYGLPLFSNVTRPAFVLKFKRFTGRFKALKSTSRKGRNGFLPRRSRGGGYARKGAIGQTNKQILETVAAKHAASRRRAPAGFRRSSSAARKPRPLSPRCRKLRGDLLKLRSIYNIGSNRTAAKRRLAEVNTVLESSSGGRAAKDATHSIAAADLWRRFGGVDAVANAKVDKTYINEFIEKKKIVNGIIIDGRLSSGLLTYDRIPYKYFHYHFRIDPAYSSFLLDKFINIFTKWGHKRKIRKIFYNVLRDFNLPVDIFYYIVDSLSPSYLNVVVRQGTEVSTAPILASKTKSTMKAIKFFKRAVMDRISDGSLEEKITNEILDYLFWDGYKNVYFERYIAVTAESMHKRHFRSQKVY